MGKDTTIQKHRQELRKTAAEPRDFIDRNYSFFLLISFLLYPLAMLWSAITEGGNIYTRALDILHSPTLALVFTILVVLFIEACVVIGGVGASNDLTEGVFGEDSSHRNMFFGKLAIFVIAYAISFNLSLDGSKQTTWAVSKAMAPPALLATDSIDAEYRKRVERQEAIIGDARTMTWKGRITRKGSAIIADAQQQIGTIEAEWSTALSTVGAENDELVFAFEEKTGENANWAWYISIFGQLIMLICIVLRTIYKGGENNWLSNVETLTGHDIDGDGHVGKPPTTTASGAEPAHVDPQALAAAVAMALREEEPARRVVKPFQATHQPPTKPVGNAPQSRVVEAVTPVAQQSQPDTAHRPTVVTETVTKTVMVRADRLRKNISTYYPRCFSKEVTPKGSKTQATRATNREKIERWLKELKDCGITLQVNFEKYDQIREV